MSDASIPPHDFVIAWAVPVDWKHLAARLEAYVETRPTITTFRFVMKYTMLKSLRKLPEEVVSKIIKQLRDGSFNTRLEWWGGREKCLTTKCTPERHEKWICKGIVMESFCKILAHSNNPMKEIDSGRPFHSGRRRGRTEKAAQILIEDFGVHPHFNITKTLDSKGKIETVQVQAYLTIPALHFPVTYNPSRESRLLTTNHHIVDPSALAGLSEHQLQHFRHVLNLLGLKGIETGNKDNNDGRDDGESGFEGSEALAPAEGTEVDRSASDSGFVSGDHKPKHQKPHGRKCSVNDTRSFKKKYDMDRPRLMILGCEDRDDLD
ncbi:hypothetical protein ACLMJK_009560 [Lecanora helva]